MTKMITSAIALVFAATASVNAQNVASATPATPTATEAKAEDKTPVKAEALPAAIQKALASDAYKGWTLSEAFLVKEGGKEYYELNLKQGDQTSTVKLDKDGNKI